MIRELFNKYKNNLSPNKSDRRNTWMMIRSEIYDAPSITTKLKPYTIGFILFLIFFSISVFSLNNLTKNNLKDDLEESDNWLLDQSHISDESQKLSLDFTAEMEGSLGYTQGGASDINNFRGNIEKGYLPIPTDITAEGIFNEYYFEKSDRENCTELLCPYYSLAISKDPISHENRHYMSIGFDSNIRKQNFERKKINLIVVLDISSSMISPFDVYYYSFGSDKSNEKSKMQIANESVTALLDHLNADDRFGIVVFNDSAFTAKTLRTIGTTDVDALKNNILAIKATGGTNMEAGLNEATNLFDNYLDDSEYENRIILLTDAMPNEGNTSSDALIEILENNAESKIFTTIIGVGVDFNTELVATVSNVTGANYYSVHNADDFSSRLDTNFDYMVTPLIFDMNLKLISNNFNISKVYGSPTADEPNDQIINIKTLFPSETSDSSTKGSMILIEFEKTNQTSNNWDIELQLDYKDGEDNLYQRTYTINKNLDSKEFYENTSIRKAIILSRYVNLMQSWIIYEWYNNPKYPIIDAYSGILPPDVPEYEQWERWSRPLYVSDNYKNIFQDFQSYFSTESDIIGDESLQQELDLIEYLIQWE